MEPWQIQRFEISGPAGPATRMHLFLSDGLDQDQSEEWIWGRTVADTRDEMQIAAVQLEALQNMQKRLETEIARLSLLLNSRS